MNTLSIVVYLINMLGPLIGFFIALTVFFGALVIINGIIYGIVTNEGHYSNPTPEWNASKIKTIKKYAVLAIMMLFISVVVPTPKTATLIAASEIGQMVIESENGVAITDNVSGVASDSMKLLRKYIQNEIDNIDGVETESEKAIKDYVKKNGKEAVLKLLTE